MSCGKVLLLAVDRVVRGLLAPVAAAAGKDEILVETPFAGAQTHLSPLSHAGGHVAGLFQHRGDHDFAAGINRVVALVADQARAKGISACEQFAARRTAERRGVAVLEPHAAGRQRVDVRRAERPAAAMDISQADVVGEDQDDIRPPGRGGGSAARAAAAAAKIDMTTRW